MSASSGEAGAGTGAGPAPVPASAASALPARKKSVLLPNTSLPTAFALPSFLPLKESQWIPDKEREICRGCVKSFGIMRRKHHCRGCGDIFCEPCSNFKLLAKGSVHTHEIVGVRVCQTCFDKHSVGEGEALHAAPVKKHRAAAHSSTAAAAAATSATPVVAALPSIVENPTAETAGASTSADAASATTTASSAQSTHPILKYLPAPVAAQLAAVPPLVLLGGVGALLMLVLALATESGAISFQGLVLLALIAAAAAYLHFSASNGGAKQTAAPAAKANGAAAKPRAVSVGSALASRPTFVVSGPAGTSMRPRSSTQNNASATNASAGTATPPPSASATAGDDSTATKTSGASAGAVGAAAVVVAGAAVGAAVAAAASSSSSSTAASSTAASASSADSTTTLAAGANGGLSANDAEIVRRSRLALSIVQGYHGHTEEGSGGWRTLRRTKPDGSGSVSVPARDERATIDWEAFVANYDDTIIVQSKMVPQEPMLSAPSLTPPAAIAAQEGRQASMSIAMAFPRKGSNSGQSPLPPSSSFSSSSSFSHSPSFSSSSAPSVPLHPIWKGVALIPHPPEHLFRLYSDQNNQCSWNKALIQSRIIRAIPGTRTTVSYCVSAPAVGGAVSAREFVDTHDWVCEQRVDGATGRVHTDYAFCGVGIDNGSSLLPPEALAACGSSSKFVRGLNGPAGFLLRSVDPSPAARAVPGADPSDRWTLFVMALDTDVRGWIPKSLTDGAMPDVILEYITNFRAAWRERTKHKEPLPPMPTITSAATTAADSR